MIESFETLEKQAKNEKSKRVAVANAEEADVLNAIVNAANQNIVKPVLVGKKDGIEKLAKEENLDISDYRIIDVKRSEKKISQKAVELVKNDEADLLMKGKVSTSYLMKAVLDKEKGLRGPGVLSHITLMEIEKYHKFLIVTDAAVTISPDLKQKIGLINNAVYAANKLGIETPKVGVVGAVEKVNP